MKYIQITFLICSLQVFSQTIKRDSVFVYYDINEFILTDLNKKSITSFLSTIDTTASFQVKIISSADYLGSVEDNRVLAGKRAKEIKLILETTYPKLFKKTETVNIGEISELNIEKKLKGNSKNRKTTIVFTKTIPTVILEEKPKIIKKKVFIYNPVKKEFDLKVGKKFVLKRLLFYRGTTKMKGSAKNSLLALLRFLKENPKIEIEIQGHLCCNAGFYQENKDLIKPLDRNNLSSKRAELVYKYLVRNRIRLERLKHNGYGFQSPIHYPETSDQDRSINKRVEIVITKI